MWSVMSSERPAGFAPKITPNGKIRSKFSPRNHSCPEIEGSAEYRSVKGKKDDGLKGARQTETLLDLLREGDNSI